MEATSANVMDFPRLVSSLVCRARCLGARDPEGAAQEALKRCLENPNTRRAIRYYLDGCRAASAACPDWPADQLLAWVQRVLFFVVREENRRSMSRREHRAEAKGNSSGPDTRDFADPAPDQLDALIRRQLRQIAAECLPTLDADYRRVLQMRASGRSYSEIAIRLGVNENTVATWVSRGSLALRQRVRQRIQTSNFTQPARSLA